MRLPSSCKFSLHLKFSKGLLCTLSTAEIADRGAWPRSPLSSFRLPQPLLLCYGSSQRQAVTGCVYPAVEAWQTAACAQVLRYQLPALWVRAHFPLQAGWSGVAGIRWALRECASAWRIVGRHLVSEDWVSGRCFYFFSFLRETWW